MELQTSLKLISFLDQYIKKRKQEIYEMEQVIERYQQKRIREERLYQAKSPLRRMFSGKKPDHHLAVEYIHYVKKPMGKIKQAKDEIKNAKVLLEQSRAAGTIEIPDPIFTEFQLFKTNDF